MKIYDNERNECNGRVGSFDITIPYTNFISGIEFDIISVKLENVFYEWLKSGVEMLEIGLSKSCSRAWR